MIRVRASLISVTVATLVGGCYGPENEFNKFNLRCGQASDGICAEPPTPPPPPNCTPPDPNDPDDVAQLQGMFFLAISSGIPTAELFPTMQQVEVSDPTPQPDGTIRITLKSRPVAACDPTMNIEDFGDPDDFFVQPDGALVVDPGDVTIPLEGNPVIPAPIRSRVLLTSRICLESPNLRCGTTKGELFEPIMSELDGTFAQVRVDMHGQVPDPIVIDCSRTEAAHIEMFPVCAP